MTDKKDINSDLNKYKHNDIDWSVKLDQPANQLLKDPIDGFNVNDK